MEKPEGKRVLISPRRRWEDNIEMVLQRVWILGRGLKLSALEQGQVLCGFDCYKGNLGSIKRWEILD